MATVRSLAILPVARPSRQTASGRNVLAPKHARPTVDAPLKWQPVF